MFYRPDALRDAQPVENKEMLHNSIQSVPFSYNVTMWHLWQMTKSTES